MTRSTKPIEERRGHGSGIAGTPEAEAARRAKISAARQRQPVRVRASYRTKHRPRVGHEGWDYRVPDEGEEFTILFNSRDAERIRLELNRRFPRRTYFDVDVLP